MATEAEEKQAIDQICEKMSDVAIGDQVKQEVASAALVMQCCFVMAKDIMALRIAATDGPGVRTEADSHRTYPFTDEQERLPETQIALALFDSVVKRSLMAQTQNPLSILSIPPGLLKQS